MTCHRVGDAIICTRGTYKVGDPKPDGYMDRIAWMEAQYKAGHRQSQCLRCGKWCFPAENHKCEPTATGGEEG